MVFLLFYIAVAPGFSRDKDLQSSNREVQLLVNSVTADSYLTWCAHHCPEA